MPSLSRRTLLALVVVTAATVGVSLKPVTVQADPPPCIVSLSRQTSVMTGYGFTCTDATNDLGNKVNAAAAAHCALEEGSVVTPQLVITEECRAYSSTQVQVTGYLRYRCRYCS